MRSLRIVDGTRIKAQFQWEPRDIWVGLFWRVRLSELERWKFLHLYICVIPFVPLHVTIAFINYREGERRKPKIVQGRIVR